MTTSAAQMRAWTGPAILSYGFRPFFLLGSVWAALAMVLWVVMLTGHDVLATTFDPVSWHAHEFLFGYLGAVLAGFLLTAVPNWTGRLPIVGWPLGALVGLWLAGRVAVATSALLPPGVAAAIDLTFPVALFAALGREVVTGRNWKNLPVLGLLLGLILANGLYHLEAAQGGYPAKGIALRMGLAVAVMMISLIGGRIVPSFTRNWLAQRRNPALPVPFGRGDRVVLAVDFRGAGCLDPLAGSMGYSGGLRSGRGLANLATVALVGPPNRGRAAGLGAARRIRLRALGVFRDRSRSLLARHGTCRPACLDGRRGRVDDAGSDDPRQPWPHRTPDACHLAHHRDLRQPDNRRARPLSGRRTA